MGTDNQERWSRQVLEAISGYLSETVVAISRIYVRGKEEALASSTPCFSSGVEVRRLPKGAKGAEAGSSRGFGRHAPDADEAQCQKQ